MTIASAGVELSDLLLERYPDLFFLLHYGFEGESLPPQEETLPAIMQALEGVNLAPLSTLYIYGLGDGAYYHALQGWLHESSDRRVIFLEDQSEALQRFLNSSSALPLFSDPQAVVRYIPDWSQIDLVIQQLMIDYPCNRLEVLAQPENLTDKFHNLRLELLRKSTISHAIVMESLKYHKLLLNILPNIRAWQGSFIASGLKGHFKGIAAVICGAGPSLQNHLPLLKTLEDKALILAGGSTITALSHNGIIPHLGLAFDPNREEYERLKSASAYEMPFIYGTRLEADVLNTLNGARGYLSSGTGGPCESYFEQALHLPSEGVGEELGMEALSVTTLSLALAVHMGCHPILFCGVDLSYTGLERYSPGVLASSAVDPAHLLQEVHAAEKHLIKPDIHGRPVSTLVKWVMESECIAAFAKKHPQIAFFNVSEAGLGFEGIPNRSFKEVLEQFSPFALDLRGLIHAQVEQLQLPPLKEKIEEEMQKIEQSLKRCSQILSAYLAELERMKEAGSEALFPSSQLTLLALDLEEEPAFSCCNLVIGPVLDRLLNRAHIFPLYSSAAVKREIQLRREIDKFTQWKELIDEQLYHLCYALLGDSCEKICDRGVPFLGCTGV